MPYRLSLLDKSPLADGESASAALSRTLQLARSAERWGYHRFWLAEHHNAPQLASVAPEILIAWILAHTTSIRVGSGGVMLQHYSPFKVAENFNLLASLAPGRVDLGVGKAPGGLPLATRALQAGSDAALKGDFATQLTQLDGWLRNRSAEVAAEDRLQATPLPAQPATRFLLGASEESAALAAQLGWQFVFAAHLNGDRELMARALTLYSARSGGEKALVAVQAIVADSPAAASALAASLQLWRVEAEGSVPITVGSEEQAQAWVRQAGNPPHRITPREVPALKGTAAQVHAQLHALHQRYDIDEFIIDTPIVDATARLWSIEQLASPLLVAA